MVECNQSALDVGSCTHLSSGAKQNPNLAAVHFVEEFRLLQVGIGFMDESHLIRRYAFVDELGSDPNAHQRLAGADDVIE